MSSTRRKITVPIQKLVPSIVTIIALCLGITSIRYSLDGKFNIAVALIMIAAFLDGVDGRIARLLNSTTEFGAQLDSLADLCNFGIAPGIAVYLWTLKDIPYKGMGWAMVLIYITCSALRLARFNVNAPDHNKKQKMNGNFFIGVPMPFAAWLLLMPIMCTFDLCTTFSFSYWFIALYMTFIGLLMVSKIPVYSGKDLSIAKEKVSIVLIVVGIVFTSIILEPWFILPILGVCYVLFIVVGVYLHYSKKVELNEKNQ